MQVDEGVRVAGNKTEEEEIFHRGVTVGKIKETPDDGGGEQRRLVGAVIVVAVVLYPSCCIGDGCYHQGEVSYNRGGGNRRKRSMTLPCHCRRFPLLVQKLTRVEF